MMALEPGVGKEHRNLWFYIVLIDASGNQQPHQEDGKGAKDGGMSSRLVKPIIPGISTRSIVKNGTLKQLGS